MTGTAIFVYHDLVESLAATPPSAHTYVLGQRQFVEHLGALDAPGLRASQLGDVLTAPGAGRFVLSFDDGHISNYTVAFPMLAARGWPGCFFIVARRVGEPHALGWRELREMAAAGMEIGSHSLTHPFLHRASAADIRREFGESKRILEEGLGQPVTLASLPYGTAGEDTRAVMAELGYRAVCTSEPGLVGRHTDHLALPRIAIKQRTPAAFLANVVAGRTLTLVTLRSCHAVKKVGRQLVGMERWRRVRRALATAVAGTAS
jgi:peptidoglycan/xylan/chitin deacetylase (PgdA/CDA1 family)